MRIRIHGAKPMRIHPDPDPGQREGQFRGQKSRGPLKMSREMAHKVIVPKKKILSQSFLNSRTLVILCLFATIGLKLCPAVS